MSLEKIALQGREEVDEKSISSNVGLGSVDDCDLLSMPCVVYLENECENKFGAEVRNFGKVQYILDTMR